MLHTVSNKLSIARGSDVTSECGGCEACDVREGMCNTTSGQSCKNPGIFKSPLHSMSNLMQKTMKQITFKYLYYTNSYRHMTRKENIPYVTKS